MKPRTRFLFVYTPFAWLLLWVGILNLVVLDARPVVVGILVGSAALTSALTIEAVNS